MCTEIKRRGNRDCKGSDTDGRVKTKTKTLMQFSHCMEQGLDGSLDMSAAASSSRSKYSYLAAVSVISRSVFWVCGSLPSTVVMTALALKERQQTRLVSCCQAEAEPRSIS